MLEGRALAADGPLPGIEHVILLMFENRSFDNMLGSFYPSASDRGGVPAGFYNPLGATKVYAWRAAVGSAAGNIPYPDPNELYVDMHEQINSPFGPMMGFVYNYATVKDADPKAVMQYYVAGNVPVTSALAMKYAACDRYFASGPVQTWPNRLFSLCGTPGYDSGTNLAYLNNDEYPDYPFMVGQLDYPTIFEQLDNAGHDWAVYYDDEEPIAFVLKYVRDSWHPLDPAKNRIHWFEPTFFDDVKAGKLPAFSLIEPRYQMLSAEGFRAPNSNHPGSSDAVSSTGPPINVSCGERMLARVFNALAANPTLFATTLLIVTYDEHGGLFDHVLPPQAVSPFTTPVNNYNYTSFGVRVPTLLINPYVRTGLFPPQALDPPVALFDHTSILATLRDQFGLSGSLSPRVDGALTLQGAIRTNQPPIPTQTIPVPACTWKGPLAGGHAEPILRSALRRSRVPQVDRPGDLG